MSGSPSPSPSEAPPRQHQHREQIIGVLAGAAALRHELADEPIQHPPHAVEPPHVGGRQVFGRGERRHGAAEHVGVHRLHRRAHALGVLVQAEAEQRPAGDAQGEREHLPEHLQRPAGVGAGPPAVHQRRAVVRERPREPGDALLVERGLGQVALPLPEIPVGDEERVADERPHARLQPGRLRVVVHAIHQHALHQLRVVDQRHRPAEPQPHDVPVRAAPQEEAERVPLEPEQVTQHRQARGPGGRVARGPGAPALGRRRVDDGRWGTHVAARPKGRVHGAPRVGWGVDLQPAHAGR
jgi:hypothetical protein